MYSTQPRFVAIASPGTGRSPTLMQAWEAYQKVRTLRSSTSQNYKEAMQNSFRDWADMPMTTITRSMVLERYLDLCLRGEPTANREMRFLKALFNFAIGYFEDDNGQPLIPANPVQKLSDVRAWKEVRRRQTMVFRQQLKKWLAGVYTMRNDASRDMALMLWLTGCRVGEARNLTWDDVDLETGLVTFRDTKNGTDYVLPLSRFLWNLLLSRRARAPLGNDYVFPGQKPGQPMGNNYKGYSEMCKRIGCAWKFHDLRRGFISLAVMLDINEITVKRLASKEALTQCNALFQTVRDINRFKAEYGFAEASLKGLCSLDRDHIFYLEVIRHFRPDIHKALSERKSDICVQNQGTSARNELEARYFPAGLDEVDNRAALRAILWYLLPETPSQGNKHGSLLNQSNFDSYFSLYPPE